jgi:hypothetical protein
MHSHPEKSSSYKLQDSPVCKKRRPWLALVIALSCGTYGMPQDFLLPRNKICNVFLFALHLFLMYLFINSSFSKLFAHNIFFLYIDLIVLHFSIIFV